MMLMKRDMTGAGVVLAVMGALADVDCPVRVTALLRWPRTPSAVGSIRPGDVLRHYGGRTTEVTNTDAEGRLVLADAMAYAVAELEPDVLVDVATLTGAMKIALGQKTGGYFATDDALADLLRDASVAAGEPLWRMPLVDDYEERLASRVADADNAARVRPARSPPRCSCSTSTAGCPGPTSTSRPWATRPTTSSSTPRAPPASVPARSCTGWSCASRSRASRREGGVHARPDGPLVAHRGAAGGRGGARRLRRGHLARPVHRQGGAALQDLADARRASGSRAATSSRPRGAGRVRAASSARWPPSRPARRSSGPRRC